MTSGFAFAGQSTAAGKPAVTGAAKPWIVFGLSTLRICVSGKTKGWHWKRPLPKRDVRKKSSAISALQKQRLLFSWPLLFSASPFILQAAQLRRITRITALFRLWSKRNMGRLLLFSRNWETIRTAALSLRKSQPNTTKPAAKWKMANMTVPLIFWKKWEIFLTANL